VPAGLPARPQYPPGAFKGRKKALNVNQVDQLRKILAAGKTKVEAARELGISRETVYAYLRGTP
jgi:hypothetical protein